MPVKAGKDDGEDEEEGIGVGDRVDEADAPAGRHPTGRAEEEEQPRRAEQRGDHA